MTEQNFYAAPQSSLDTQIEEFYQPKILSWSGRIGRLRYLAYGMGMLFVFIVLAAIIGKFFLVAGVRDVAIALVIILYISIFVYWVSIAKRRLNDVNLSGWYCALLVLPFVNTILVLALMFIPGTNTSNAYGAVPIKNSTGVIIIAVFTMVMVVPAMVASFVQFFRLASSSG